MLQIHHSCSFGLVEFHAEVPRAYAVELIFEGPLRLLVEDEDWDLSARDYRQISDSKALKAIKTLNIKHLKMRWSEAESILKDIKNISFPCLQELNLNGNNIISIEALIFADYPQLKSLNLKQNCIHEIKALRKCKMPNLEQLMIYQNKILDFSSLSELRAPKLTVIWSTSQNKTFDSNDTNSWVFKIESRHLNKIFVRHERSTQFNYSSWRAMVKNAYPASKLVYKPIDDIRHRLE